MRDTSALDPCEWHSLLLFWVQMIMCRKNQPQLPPLEWLWPEVAKLFCHMDPYWNYWLSPHSAAYNKGVVGTFPSECIVHLIPAFCLHICLCLSLSSLPCCSTQVHSWSHVGCFRFRIYNINQEHRISERKTLCILPSIQTPAIIQLYICKHMCIYVNMCTCGYNI